MLVSFPLHADVGRLARYGEQVRDIILSRQDPHTGLLPASTAITVHGDYTHAWVRDNVYSIQAVWALALAWRRAGSDGGREKAEPLENAVVRLMRGLLAAMMRQAHKVERFKQTQNPLDALHAKYDTHTGEVVVGDSEWGHLQLDATAVFLLMLAQMSASGLAIVETPDELAFVQNLVYYLAKAWRTPDYGIWERGDKRNGGVAELNASSLGMVKAALEAIDGFDPFDDHSGGVPPVLVVGDDVARARDALAALLPRESESKETDAALLSVIGFPAYAVDDAALADRTRAEILGKLGGHYGCKRFLRDGHQTMVEDHGRLHYEPGELTRFANIESEWPLFFSYLLVDAAMRGDEAEARSWRDKLETLMVEKDGQCLLPELYYVPREAVDAERADPGSQQRLPNDNVPLVWAQSLYIVGALLQDGLLTPADLDPLGRRFSFPRQTRVQLVLLAEDELARSRMAAHGLTAQTPVELGAVRVREAQQLAGLLHGLGRCEALGLTGRPLHRLGSIATGRLYWRAGDAGPSLVLPPLFWRRNAYFALDNRLLADEVANEIATLRRQWQGVGQPVFALRVTGRMLDAPGADALMARLVKLVADPGVQAGPLQQLLPQISASRLDGRDDWPPALHATHEPSPEAGDTPPDWEEAATRPLWAERAAALASTLHANPDTAAIRRQAERCRNPYEQIEIVAVLMRRAELTHDEELAGAMQRLARAIHARASREGRWGVIRRAAGLLDLHDNGLEDAVAELVAHGKRVTLGRAYSADAVVVRPLANAELLERIRHFGGDDPRGRVLIEETVLLMGMLIKAEPALFEGTLTLRPWQSLRLISGWLSREHELSPSRAFDLLHDLSPHAILGRLQEVMRREQEMNSDMMRLQLLHTVDSTGAIARVDFPAHLDPQLDADQGGWLGWREMSGVLGRVPEDFHQRISDLLTHCTGLVIGDQLDGANRVDSALALADSTRGERGFALQVDERLSKIHAPEYRQLNIEALTALQAFMSANPTLKLDSPLVLDVLIGHAVRIGWEQTSDRSQPYAEQVPQAWAAFYASPPHRVANLTVAAVLYLLEERA
ncbi:glycoside hydrolase family 15 protein [Paucibacter sp. R3-3]|uniref:Glycoside hydrolase family 15 protein n=1 Tax=Roseateles agri TaxID=3098619 RepID=A0ABU5DQM3_9BURK|nr:glycoside hydrolase family 15 protein [Paucibacter sp. R3-3]MDY0748627.1 glycoside hydrolase family 15 protein [Paucibacter sp. R3-3]